MKHTNFNVMKNKKGVIESLLVFAVIMVILAIFILIIAKVIPSITDELRKTEINNSAEARTALNWSDKIVGRLDTVFMIFFVGLIMGILISSYFISTNKIFIPIYIILFGFTIIIGVILNNMYEAFKTSSDLITTSVTYPMMNVIISNYVIVLIAVGVLSMILMFGKPSGSPSGERI